MKRLLCLVSAMNAGGAETFLMKLYRQLDKNKYQMDFCVNIFEKGFYDDEIQQIGGKIFHIPAKTANRKEFKKQLYKIVKEEKYEYVMRITSNSMGFMDLMIAKKAGAKVCIARSSNSSDGDGFYYKVAHRIGKILYEKYVDVKLAPSDLAAQYTFGNKAYARGDVKILHNAVDLSVFKYDYEGRLAVRKEFGIPAEAVLIGHVGRFSNQKNHEFLIQIFAEIHKKNPEARLMLVGNGELESQIIKQAKQLNLFESIFFVGIRSDIPQILSAMDVFVFPSFYEGMPNTVIEAQATGLSCIISDRITEEANITKLVKYESLAMSAETWAKEALELATNSRENTHNLFRNYSYDIETVTRLFENYIFKSKGEE